MNILSRGDQLRPGRYQLHSSFPQAINFSNGEWLLSLVSEKVGSGPVNLVLRKLPEPERCHALQLDEAGRQFSIAGEGFDLSAVALYDSSLPSGLNGGHWRQNLESLRLAVAAQAPSESLAFLLDEQRRDEFHGAFQAAFVHRITTSSEQLLQGDLLAGVRGFKGCGIGLTPSGDDFLAGLLLALSCLELAAEPLAPPLRHLINRIFHESRGESFLSNAFLALAARGQVFARTRALLQALAERDAKEVAAAAVSAMAVGATSGADLLVGLCVGLAHETRFAALPAPPY